MTQTQSTTIDEQRRKVIRILINSGKRELIKKCIERGEVVLKPDLDISCNVGAQADVLSVLQSFQPQYLSLVLEAVLKIRIDCTNELSFMENLEKTAQKHIFHSPSIAKNKKYVYTRGNWLTDEGKKAVESHFLKVFCQILYLMEQCVVQKMIPEVDLMFKPGTDFLSMRDVFSFISRELIGGKTLFPKVMESIGFKPTHSDPSNDPNRSSAGFSRPSNGYSNRSLLQLLDSNNEHFKNAPDPAKDPINQQPPANISDRIKQRLKKEIEDSHINELFNQMDQSEMTSLMSQTVENIDKHIRGLTGNQASIQALYEQLKHTANFLADIVKALGLDDSQVEVIMQKINQLNLEIQETGELTAQLAQDTNKIVAELSVVSMRIEQTMQSTVVEAPRDKVLDDLISKNKVLVDQNNEFAKKEETYLSEIKSLQEQVESIRLEKENTERQLSNVTKGKKEAERKYADTMKLVVERDDELENRKHIIEELRIEIEQQKLPDNLEQEIGEQLQAIHDVMFDVTNRMNKI